MSSVAAFNLLPKTALDELGHAASQGGYHEFISQRAREVVDYPWSGYALATLLPYLEEDHQIDLMQSEHDQLAAQLSDRLGVPLFIFTHAHKQAYLNKLAPELFSEEKLRQYYTEFNAADEPDIGAAMLEGIRALRQSLSALDEGSVVVCIIG
jgi:hypothetical protein